MAEKHGGTRFGPYLDDIADFLSFGICPAYILFELGGEHRWFYVPCFVFGVGYRLVRFVTVDKHRVDLPKGIFNGLPSPAGAIIVLGTCLIFKNELVLWFATTVSIVLMASEIRFAHFGKVILREIPKPIFILGSAAMMLLLAYIVRVRRPEMFGWFLLSCVTIYMIVGKIIAIQKQRIFSANQQTV
jgi:CDP-diacylglycerol--serine O-phosphatidyltransferase